MFSALCVFVYVCVCVCVCAAGLVRFYRCLSFLRVLPAVTWRGGGLGWGVYGLTGDMVTSRCYCPRYGTSLGVRWPPAHAIFENKRIKSVGESVGLVLRGSRGSGSRSHPFRVFVYCKSVLGRLLRVNLAIIPRMCCDWCGQTTHSVTKNSSFISLNIQSSFGHDDIDIYSPTLNSSARGTPTQARPPPAPAPFCSSRQPQSQRSSSVKILSRTHGYAE